MIDHLKSFVLFYVASHPVEIESRYDVPQSLSRILQLNERGEVRVRKTKKDRLIAVGAQWGPRSNVLPVFEGALEKIGEHVVLRGQVGIDPGIRMVLGMICFFVFVFFPLHLDALLGGTQTSAPGFGYIIGPLVLLGLLGFGYLIGKDDPTKIVKNLRQVLNDNERT